MMKQNSSSSQKIADGNDATINTGVYDDNNNYNQAQTQSQYHPMNFNFTVSLIIDLYIIIFSSTYFS